MTSTASTIHDDDTLQLPKLLKLEDVVKMTGIPRSTLYERLNAGTFPKPIRLGKRSPRWLLDDVQAIFDAWFAGKSDDEVKKIVAQLHADREERARQRLAA